MLALTQHIQVGNSLSHVLGSQAGGFEAGPGQNEHKFFLAEAAGNIVSTYIMQKKTAQLADDGVPGIVTQDIEAFEVIDRKHDKAQGVLASQGARQFPLCGLFQVTAIKKPAQRITYGLSAQLFTQANIGK